MPVHINTRVCTALSSCVRCWMHQLSCRLDIGTLGPRTCGIKYYSLMRLAKMSSGTMIRRSPHRLPWLVLELIIIRLTIPPFPPLDNKTTVSAAPAISKLRWYLNPPLSRLLGRVQGWLTTPRHQFYQHLYHLILTPTFSFRRYPFHQTFAPDPPTRSTPIQALRHNTFNYTHDGFGPISPPDAPGTVRPPRKHVARRRQGNI